MAANMFVKISDIPGDATEDQHKTWIVIKSLSWNAERAVDLTDLGSTQRGHANTNFQKVSVTSELGLASAKLMAEKGIFRAGTETPRAAANLWPESSPPGRPGGATCGLADGPLLLPWCACGTPLQDIPGDQPTHRRSDSRGAAAACGWQVGGLPQHRCGAACRWRW